jgi:polar amino acid transport system substrate-binding protein
MRNSLHHKKLAIFSKVSLKTQMRFLEIPKINFAVCLFLFAANAVFTGCSKPEPRGLTAADGVLSVGIEIGYPPMEYYDTDGVTLVGFDIELAKALAGKLGLQVNFIDTAWDGILAGLDSGKYDIAVNITILPERQKRHNFTKPYIDSSMAIVIRKDSSLKIEKPEDIAGHRVSCQNDTTAQYFTEKLSERGVKFTFFSYDKILNCFDDLKLGRVDAVVVDNIAAFDYAGKDDSPFEVVWQGPSDELIGNSQKKGNDALTAALNNALDELFAEGTMLRISREIFGRDMVSSVRK